MVASATLAANSELYYVLMPRGPVSKAILWHHGAGGETTLADPLYGQVNIRALQQRLVDAGFVILSCDFGGAQTWANAGNQTKITAAVTWLSTIGCRTDKVGLWGTSMGFACLATWAKNNTAKVASLVGTIPCADSQWAYTNNVALQSPMNTAWSGNWTTNGKPTTDPSVIYAGLTAFPVRLWYATDDTTVGPSTSPALASLINGIGGAAVATSMGTGGHTDAPLASIDQASFVTAFESGAW